LSNIKAKDEGRDEAKEVKATEYHIHYQEIHSNSTSSSNPKALDSSVTSSLLNLQHLAKISS
jgi:hypothetical protein